MSLEAFQNWFRYFPNDPPAQFPTDFFLAALEIIMKLNVFSFDDTFWLQTSGTAMGTPAACNYATIAFAFLCCTSVAGSPRNTIGLNSIHNA